MESELPTILTFVRDGTYTEHMQSDEKMQELIDYLTAEKDRSANMNW